MDLKDKINKSSVTSKDLFDIKVSGGKARIGKLTRDIFDECYIMVMQNISDEILYLKNAYYRSNSDNSNAADINSNIAGLKFQAMQLSFDMTKSMIERMDREIVEICQDQ